MNEKTCTDVGAESTTCTRRPRVDVVRREDEVRIYADMPGTDEDSIEVILEDDTLVLRGTPTEEVPEGMELRWAEFELGPYERRFSLRDDLAREGIHASVKGGVVEVVIPKRVEETRRIPITAR